MEMLSPTKSSSGLRLYVSATFNFVFIVKVLINTPLKIYCNIINKNLYAMSYKKKF